MKLISVECQINILNCLIYVKNYIVKYFFKYRAFFPVFARIFTRFSHVFTTVLARIPSCLQNDQPYL